MNLPLAACARLVPGLSVGWATAPRTPCQPDDLGGSGTQFAVASFRYTEAAG